jgi:hypothetical protein
VYASLTRRRRPLAYHQLQSRPPVPLQPSCGVTLMTQMVIRFTERGTEPERLEQQSSLRRKQLEPVDDDVVPERLI